MTPAMRSVMLALALLFLAVGLYHRILSLQSKEPLDRRQEGWPILIGLRLAGALTLLLTAAYFRNPAALDWAAIAVPQSARWVGVAGFGLAVAWLSWMFIALGRNLTDTVVTRRDARFVEHGPYRYVRNPMYTGVLLVGLTLGLAFGTWLLPASAALLFGFMAVRTRIEERFLIARFGDQYREYMSRVGRFFPRLTHPENR